MSSRTFNTDLQAHIKKIDKQVRLEMYKGLQEIGEEWHDYYVLVIQDWKNKPEFIRRVIIEGTHYLLYVEATGENANIWMWVDEGTKPHIIRPKKPGYPLRFRGGYSAKTAAPAQYGVGDGKAHGAARAAYVVYHPGNEAREFSEEAAERTKPRLVRILGMRLAKAINRI